MLTVTQAQINAWNDELSEKSIRLYFPQLNKSIDKTLIYAESPEVSESICDSDTIEFKGCIANSLSVQISGLSNTYKGTRVIAYAEADNTGEIPIFNGIVDSVQSQNNKTFKKLVAYDELYTKGNIDVAEWLNNLSYPLTLKTFRDSLFSYIGIEQVADTLPCDNLVVEQEAFANEFQALALIENICQVNGRFGIINRSGKFEYRKIETRVMKKGLFPSLVTFPSGSTFPSMNSEGKDAVLYAYYRNCNYEEYITDNVTKVTVRPDEDTEGQSYGTDGNRYIIEGNYFCVSDQAQSTVAETVYNEIKEVSYKPFSAILNCLPYVEVGDIIQVATASGIIDLPVLSRKMQGIQALKDTMSAKGTKEQKEFVSKTSVNLSSIRNQIAEIKEEIESVVVRLTVNSNTVLQFPMVGLIHYILVINSGTVTLGAGGSWIGKTPPFTSGKSYEVSILDGYAIGFER